MTMKATLTSAQLEALSNVATGKVSLLPALGPSSRPKWHLAGTWQSLRPQPYLALLAAGLIAECVPTGTDLAVGSVRYDLTEAGRAELDR